MAGRPIGFALRRRVRPSLRCRVRSPSASSSRAPLCVVLPHEMLVTHLLDRQNYVEGLGEARKQRTSSSINARSGNGAKRARQEPCRPSHEES